MNIAEVISKLLYDDDKRFECRFNCRILEVDDYGEINWNDADVDEHLILDEECLKSYTFTEINEPISVHDALMLWLDGTTVECSVERDGYTEYHVYTASKFGEDDFSDEHGSPVTAEEMKSGIWRAK